MTIETTAQFTIQYTRYLDEEGRPLGPLPAFATDPAVLHKLYRWMVLTRTFDLKAINLQRTGKMGTYAASLGQEGVSVAIGHTMASDDVLVPAYREYGAQFQRGVKMVEILRFWGGMESGNCYENCPQDFPIAVPIGTQPLHASGIATAMKYRKEKRAALSVCGDGATSQGDFYEAMNVAGAWHLPVVFVINNNQWAISISRKSQTNCETLAQKGLAAGIPSQQVDGNDIIAMVEVLDKALTRARSGKGPSVIEAITYRLHDHTTADDASRYRAPSEVEQAWHAEPVKRLKLYMQGLGLWDEAYEQRLVAECQAEVDVAVQEYFATEAEPVTVMFDYHFAELTHDLVPQRATAQEYAHTVRDKH